jgi:hypothetical protein
MGQKLNPVENEIYKRVDEVLYYLWDPIGVSPDPEARDEYYSYIPEIFSLLMDSEDRPGDKKKILDKLLTIQQIRIGINNEDSQKKVEKIVEILFRHKKWVTKNTKWRK